ncbi:MAG: aldo/keto reductase [Thermoguttaceae bacterium]|jgi:aryl-alcohol dehydrogenase-like predicted oxidoreductase
MAETHVTRREFVRDGALAAAGMAVGLSATYTVQAGNPQRAETGKILNYNPDMEYRRCGKTNLMVSAVCLGGHWKRVEQVVSRVHDGRGWIGVGVGNSEFEKNRYDVVTRCIERGMNYIDACVSSEVLAYSKALQGRRDKMYLGYSWYENEMRNPAFRKFEKLKESFNDGLKQAKLEYVDLWRVTCNEQSGQHTQAEIDELVKTMEWAKKSGRARFTGISSHDRPHIKKLIEKYPGQFEVICTPYTAKTKVVTDESGLWAAMKKLDVGWFGIKPFASNSVFKGDSSPKSPSAEEDNRIARLALRAILCNPAITAPIPGLITPQQVDNAALAVKERRELDHAERAELERVMDRAWANLPSHYQWLKNWEYV